MDKEKYIPIGKIVTAHGIRGGLKVFSYLEKPENFEKYKRFYIDGKEIKLELNFIKGTTVVIDIEGLRKRELAEALIGKEIFIGKDELPELKGDEFYYSDLIGLKVVEKATGKDIGEITAVENFGAGDLFEIKFKDSKDKNKLFAFSKKTFPNINVKDGFVEAVLPEEEFDN